jgi:hypothetical protein
MNSVENVFTEEYKQALIEKTNAKYQEDLEDCDTSLMAAMCKAEFEANMKKIESNIDPFKVEPPADSDFECVGCGS